MVTCKWTQIVISKFKTKVFTYRNMQSFYIFL